MKKPIRRRKKEFKIHPQHQLVSFTNKNKKLYKDEYRRNEL